MTLSKQHDASIRFNELSDDILISIVSLCDIETLFSLRLSCSDLCATIDRYSSTIASKVAKVTFPGCDVLLERPDSGYSLAWLRGLIPAQLASVVLDKDKLRRYPYIHSGYPYGIPSESRCNEAKHWRGKVANGWRVLRSLYLASEKIHKAWSLESRRPSAVRKLSGGVRSSRFWQAMSCPYPGCTEHGMKHLFDGRQQRCSELKQVIPKEENVEQIRRREESILKSRLAIVNSLSDQDLLSYVYLWRVILWAFRPYREPDNVKQEGIENDVAQQSTNWASIIHDISQGCSWLNWFILSVGPDPFIRQWCAAPDDAAKASTHIRDLIWKAYAARTPHQIEVEREYICKLEYMIRRRCLSSDRLKRLDAEIFRGRNIRTISLDCIPWEYDQHPMIPRHHRDFPWYKPKQLVWMTGGYYLRIKPGTDWAIPGVFKESLEWHDRSNEKEVGLDTEEDGAQSPHEKGPLERVPYLIYLGLQSAVKVWPLCMSSDTEIAF